eukprot:163513-Lingulodinium_polyedra.AAC.1
MGRGPRKKGVNIEGLHANMDGFALEKTTTRLSALVEATPTIGPTLLLVAEFLGKNPQQAGRISGWIQSGLLALAGEAGG